MCGVQSSVALKPQDFGFFAAFVGDAVALSAVLAVGFDAAWDRDVVEGVLSSFFEPPDAAPMMMSRTKPPAMYFFM